MTRRHAALALAATLAACSGGGGDDGGGGPPPLTEVEPNGTRAQATPLAIPTSVAGSISGLGDGDFYVFTVPAGGASVRFQTFDAGGAACDPANGDVDPFVEVYDATGTFLGGDDDGGLAPWCEDVALTLAAGTNYVMVGGFPPYPFSYTLRVTIP